MFRVALKESAIKQSGRVSEIVRSEGTIKEFESKDEAESFVNQLRERDGALRLQSAAPQDPEDVDAYLITGNQQNEWEPIESEKQGTTFPLGANTYGGVGLGLVYLGGKTSPALAHFFTEQAPPAKQGRVRQVNVEPTLPEDLFHEVNWNPDLRITVSSDGHSTNDVYFAEVKSGNASFERQQRKGMKRVSEEYGVLRIRVDIEDLPETYTVRIAEVKPDEWPE